MTWKEVMRTGRSASLSAWAGGERLCPEKGSGEARGAAHLAGTAPPQSEPETFLNSCKGKKITKKLFLMDT